ncbi:MAG TPA: phosphotransferase [Polyangiaceae bacterium]|nr:phosphotransferase [Polyangiaceae bacterium]
MTAPQPSWPYLNELVRSLYPNAGELDPEPMQGGASTRRFFRIALDKAGKSAVAMFVPGSPTHEIHKVEGHARWPFLEVRDLLAERGIRVPAIYADGTERGWLVVEDLGDDTVANYLLRKPQAKRDVYQMAVRDLARAQQRLSNLPEACIVRSRAFDRDLLRWEIEHFMEWGILARGIAISDADRAAFASLADGLAAKIAAWPRGFVHRDYQSRNLMVVSSQGDEVELAWVDFQDAMLGPRVYDLVALLSDSYQEFDHAFIEERLDEYADHAGLPKAERGELRREFDYVTVQRKLKDAGRFIFIDRKNDNPSFLPFFAPTIKKARAAIDRLGADAEMQALGGLLDRVLGP